MLVDYVGHFRREVAGFEDAVRVAAAAEIAPQVPSCPGWVMTDLVLHLGTVHRAVTTVIVERMTGPPVAPGASSDLLEMLVRWLPPGQAPPGQTPPALPLPPDLIGWFSEGARLLEQQFRAVPPQEPVWTWWHDHSVGFWHRVQAIEAAVHRWDAENAIGIPRPVPPDLASDTVSQTFEVMAPARRARVDAPPGRGERYRFQRSDGPGAWTLRFGADGVGTLDPSEPADVTVTATASDLALFLWQRIPADRLHVEGDPALLTRYFELVPPM
ncbi:maleylpyruvate isomerase family mycothiol-dependent enzyme [Streptosporangium sp. KLBMP 9127]|nr:maleylpyruvate isomerase family mycothiol-dependent enzyme [Streptosporangium sp. KLBMP 9127]